MGECTELTLTTHRDSQQGRNEQAGDGFTVANPGLYQAQATGATQAPQLLLHYTVRQIIGISNVRLLTYDTA